MSSNDESISEGNHETGGQRADEAYAPSASAAPGAQPTNRAPGNCMVLRHGIDSLYLSYGGSLRDEWAQLLEEARTNAQSPLEALQARAQVSLLDHLFQVKSGGSKLFRYTLADGCFHIQLARRKSGSKIPVAYVQIRSQFLTAVGVQQAVAQLRLVLSGMAELTGEPNVSRVDLFADYTSPIILDAWDRKAWVTRASYIGTHFVHGEPSGWSIGSGDLLARLYDKTLELQRSGKDYLKPLWLAAGWTPDQPVYRMEFEFKNLVLKEMGVRDFASLLERQGALWRYACEDWLRLAVPNSDDSTRARWATHPLWRELTDMAWDGIASAERIPLRKDQAPSSLTLLRGYFSVLTSYMALRGITDPLEAASLLTTEAEADYDRYGVEAGIRFDAATRVRAAAKATRYCLPYPGTTPIDADQAQAAAVRAYRKATGRD